VPSPVELIVAHRRRLEGEGEIEQEPVSALEYLQSIYRNPTEDQRIRLRAAIEALPFESPKLSSVAMGHFSGQDFAAMLDRAVTRSAAGAPLKLIEAQAVEVD
jgi:hypothetical protein